MPYPLRTSSIRQLFPASFAWLLTRGLIYIHICLAVRVIALNNSVFLVSVTAFFYILHFITEINYQLRRYKKLFEQTQRYITTSPPAFTLYTMQLYLKSGETDWHAATRIYTIHPSQFHSVSLYRSFSSFLNVISFMPSYVVRPSVHPSVCKHLRKSILSDKWLDRDQTHSFANLPFSFSVPFSSAPQSQNGCEFAL